MRKNIKFSTIPFNMAFKGFLLFSLLLASVLVGIHVTTPKNAGTSMAIPSSSPSITSPQAPLNIKNTLLYTGFIENKGQIRNPDLLFTGQTENMHVGIAKDHVELIQVNNENKIAVVTIKFANANPGITPIGTEPKPTTINYIRSSGTVTIHSLYQEVVFPNLWNNIDLVYRLSSSGLKYDLIVKQGADLSQVGFEISGDGVQVSSYDTKLTISTRVGKIIDNGLYVYQKTAKGEVPLNARFSLTSPTTYGFEITDAIDPNYPVVVDPLIYSTLIGGGVQDVTNDIVYYNFETYIIGSTDSIDFNVSPDALNQTYNFGMDVFVAKLNSSNELVYASFIGGFENDVGVGIAVSDIDGSVYITGYTDSSDFPVNGEFTQKNLLIDSFLMKLNNSLNEVLWSTFIGGNGDDFVQDISLNGNTVVIGGYTSSTTYPVSTNTYDSLFQGEGNTSVNGFVTAYSSNGYMGGSTYYGGNDTFVTSVLYDGTNVFVGGYTNSPYLATPNAMINATYVNNTDGFIAKFSTVDLVSLSYASYVGGDSLDQVTAIVKDPFGNLYLGGNTASFNFPITSDALNKTKNGVGLDSFIIRISSNDALVTSTYFGGGADEVLTDIEYDTFSSGVIITGYTLSNNYLVTTHSFDTTFNGGNDIFITRFSFGLTSVLYSTYYGGSDQDYAFNMVVDDIGDVHIVGQTLSSDFPVTEDAFRSSGSLSEGFYVVLTPDALPWIEAVVQSTYLPKAGEPVTVYLNASDDQFIQYAYIEYWFNNDSGTYYDYNFVLMNELAPGYYNYTIPGYPSASTVYYAFTLIDSRGNLFMSDTYMYQVDSPPIIANIFRDKSEPTELDNVTVFASINDDVNVSFAYLEVSIDNGTAISSSNITMGYDPLTNLWNATINPQDPGITVSYRIFANDTEDQWSVSEMYFYTVQEYTPPPTTTTPPSTTTTTTESPPPTTTTTTTSYITPPPSVSKSTTIIPSILPTPTTTTQEQTTTTNGGFFARLDAPLFPLLSGVFFAIITLIKRRK